MTGEGAALGPGGMSEPKPVGKGGREPLPPASPSDLVPFLWEWAARCSAQGPGRALLTVVRAVLVPGRHRPSALPSCCKLTQSQPLRPAAKTSRFSMLANISKPPEVLLRPEAQNCAWPSGQAAQQQRTQPLCEPRGAPRGLGAGVCCGQKGTAGRRVVLPGCVSPCPPTATGLGGPLPGKESGDGVLTQHRERSEETPEGFLVVWAPPGSVAQSCHLNKDLRNVCVCFLTFRKKTAESKP